MGQKIVLGLESSLEQLRLLEDEWPSLRLAVVWERGRSSLVVALVGRPLDRRFPVRLVSTDETIWKAVERELNIRMNASIFAW